MPFRLRWHKRQENFALSLPSAAGRLFGLNRQFDGFRETVGSTGIHILDLVDASGLLVRELKVPHATCVQPGSGVKLLPPSSLTEIVMRALPDGLGPSFGKLIDLTVKPSSCGSMTYPQNFDLLWQASHRQPPLMQPPKIFHVYPSLSVTDTSFVPWPNCFRAAP